MKYIKNALIAYLFSVIISALLAAGVVFMIMIIVVFTSMLHDLIFINDIWIIVIGVLTWLFSFNYFIRFKNVKHEMHSNN